MANWNIQDGFWHLNCREEEEWNFCYVWPQAPGEPVRLVVPRSLQMGWVELAPYFCAASKMARDVVVDYSETQIGALQEHKFESWAEKNEAKINTHKKGLTAISSQGLH